MIGYGYLDGEGVPPFSVNNKKSLKNWPNFFWGGWGLKKNLAKNRFTSIKGGGGFLPSSFPLTFWENLIRGGPGGRGGTPPTDGFREWGF